MAVRVAITGFGRIGRCVARLISDMDDVELVCINDTTSKEMTKYLLKYDSVHGTFDKDVELLEGDYIQIGSMKVKLLNDRDPKNLDFAKYGAEILLECTGAFYTQ
jgi:glyceraldehyde 3-phosphate dehydrogenase